MRKLKDIPEAWGNAEPGDEDWEKDRLIALLKHEGQQPISIGRAVVVIEQCEEGDPNLGGWSRDPLRLTVYPDPDAGFGPEPAFLYVNACRSGIMDLYLVPAPGKGPRRLVALDAEKVSATMKIEELVAVRALRELVEQTLHGYVWLAKRETFPSGITETVAVPGGQNEELVRLGKDAAAAVERYAAALAKVPGLFTGFDRDDYE